MKYFILLAITFFFTLEGLEPPQFPSRTVSELSLLDRVIEATQDNLKSQLALKKEVEKYLDIQHRYESNTKDRQLMEELVFSAHQLLNRIKELHLTQAFPQDFLSELTFFSGIVERRSS